MAKKSAHKKSYAPHDLFFKDVFSQKPFAIELLKLVFSPEEQKLFNFQTLKNENPAFKSQRADLVFSLELKPSVVSNPVFPREKSPPQSPTSLKAAGEQSKSPALKTKKAFIFLILEHKSQKDEAVLVQLLSYQALLYAHFLKQTGSIVPIIPLIFYHGKRAWQPRSFQSMFEKNVFSVQFENLFTKNVVNFWAKVLNLQSFDEKQMESLKRLKSGIALYLLKKIWYFKWPEDGKEMIQWVKNLSEEDQNDLLLLGSEYIKYVCGVSQQQLEKLELQALKTKVLRKGGSMGLLEYVKQQKIKEITQTARREGLKKGLRQGIKQGIEQGMEQGMKQGMKYGMRQVALNMLHKHADMEFICKVTGLSKGEVDKLSSGEESKPENT